MSRTPPAEIPCPRCGAPVGPEQAWCLTCGAPARTRMRPTPNWKLPLITIAVVVLVVAGGTVGAFVALTTDNEAPPANAVQTPNVPEAVPPPAAPETPAAPAASPDPVATTPPIETTPPAATTAASTGTQSAPVPPPADGT